jgi:hypothetical protein
LFHLRLGGRTVQYSRGISRGPKVWLFFREIITFFQLFPTRLSSRFLTHLKVLYAVHCFKWYAAVSPSILTLLLWILLCLLCRHLDVALVSGFGFANGWHHGGRFMQQSYGCKFRLIFLRYLAFSLGSLGIAALGPLVVIPKIVFVMNNMPSGMEALPIIVLVSTPSRLLRL